MQSVNSATPTTVLTPSQEVWQGECESLQVPGELGYLEVLPGHTPLVTTLRPGFLRLKQTSGQGYKSLFVSGGFLTIGQNSWLVLAEVAETKVQIDRKRAEEARARAEARINSREAQIDMGRAQKALLRAMMRIEFLDKSLD